MHHQLPPLTISGTVLKQSDDLDILGVTFGSKMTFESSFSKNWYVKGVLVRAR